MASYADAITNVQNKIALKGMPLVYVSVTNGQYNPTTNTMDSIEERTECYGLRTSPSIEEVQGGIFASGSDVVLIAGGILPDPPTTKDYLEFSDIKWDVTGVRTVAPAGVAILHKIQVSEQGTM